MVLSHAGIFIQTEDMWPGSGDYEDPPEILKIGTCPVYRSGTKVRQVSVRSMQVVDISNG